MVFQEHSLLTRLLSLVRAEFSESVNRMCGSRESPDVINKQRKRAERERANRANNSNHVGLCNEERRSQSVGRSFGESRPACLRASDERAECRRCDVETRYPPCSSSRRQPALVESANPFTSGVASARRFSHGESPPSMRRALIPARLPTLFTDVKVSRRLFCRSNLSMSMLTESDVGRRKKKQEQRKYNKKYADKVTRSFPWGLPKSSMGI